MTAYAELAVATCFSFLRGASYPGELVAQAKALGHAAIAVTDRNTLAGVVRAHAEARAWGLRLVIGARLVFAEGRPTSWPIRSTGKASPPNPAAHPGITRKGGKKGDCTLGLDDLMAQAEGLCLALAPPIVLDAGLETTLDRLVAAAPERVWPGRMAYGPADARRLDRLADLAARTGARLLATNDALYHAPGRRPLQDVMSCIREHATLEAAAPVLEANAERHLKPPQEMARLFADHPEAIDETVGWSRAAASASTSCATSTPTNRFRWARPRNNTWRTCAAAPADPTRGVRGQRRVEHGRLRAGAGPGGVRREQGRRHAVHRGAVRRAAGHTGER